MVTLTCFLQKSSGSKHLDVLHEMFIHVHIMLFETSEFHVFSRALPTPASVGASIRSSRVYPDPDSVNATRWTLVTAECYCLTSCVTSTLSDSMTQVLRLAVRSARTPGSHARQFSAAASSHADTGTWLAAGRSSTAFALSPRRLLPVGAAVTRRSCESRGGGGVARVARRSVLLCLQTQPGGESRGEN